MGFSLTSGSRFTDRPMGERRVAVLNQEAVDLYLGSSRATGAAVIDDRGIRTTIVGIVHSRSFGIFQRKSEPTIYFPMWQDCPRRMTLVAVSSKPKEPVVADLLRTVESVP